MTRRPSRFPAAAVFLACLALATNVAGAAAQETPSDTLLTIEHYLDWEQVQDPQISPDGAQIVYTRRWVNKLEDKWESALWIMAADGSRNRFLAKGGDARWSPDGSRILYVGEGEPKGSQIFVRWMDAQGATSQVTRLTAGPSAVRWAPDGRWISFVGLVPAPNVWRISMPAAPTGAHWTEPPRIVGDLHYRQDQRGFMERGTTQLFVVPADGGTARQVTRGDGNVGARFDGLVGSAGYDWTPDGKALVFDGLRDSTWDYNYRNSHVYSVDVTSGEVRQLTARPGTWTSPVISPDGRSIAFIGVDSGRYSYRTSALYVMGIDGSNPHVISGDLDRDPATPLWAPDNSGVYFTVQDRGTSNIYLAALRGGGARKVTDGSHVLAMSSLTRDLVAVGTRTSFRVPPDIVRFSLRTPQTITQLTSVNEDVMATMRLADTEEIWYTSSAGTRVQGWIVKPAGFDRARRYPLIMEIHGGPHGNYNVGFSYQYQNFAANGFVVLYVNPRGSTGYGSDFGNAIERAYPGVDYDDLMAGVDTVVGRGYVDTDRMYVGGCSGGGVLSSWVIGHTDRFAAAAVRCPVIDWISMAGQTDVPFFEYNFFERPFWEDPQPWLRQSPLMYVGNVKTPTLLMTGEQDMRTPMPQTEEYFSALRMRHVPAMLLRFNDQYHGTGTRPSNYLRTQLYMMSWYQRWRHGTGAPVQASGAEAGR